MSVVGRADVAVIGLGATGSAVASALARRGWSVAGFDQFRPPHRLGSSHGQTRIIREAYWEDPVYVPLVRRAATLWRELEATHAVRLLSETGGLFMGLPEGGLLRGIRRAAREHGVEIKAYSPQDLRREFPQFSPSPDMEGLFEPRTGILHPEEAIQTFLADAASHGAKLSLDTKVTLWGVDRSGPWVSTDSGRQSVSRLVLAAGAWMPRLLGPRIPLSVERVTSHWFRPAPGPGSLHLGSCPVFGFELEPDGILYGTPDEGRGVKVALHHGGQPADPSVVKAVTPDEQARVSLLARRFLPRLTKAPIASEPCLYTNTPDGGFIIDWDPTLEGVFVASPCSGHGFKFAPALGELVADALDGKTPPPAFRLGRAP